MEQEYYVVDYHKNMVELAEVTMEHLKKEGHHTVVYLTDLEDNFMINRVDQDEFLRHFSAIND